jgi:hypothetical protein
MGVEAVDDMATISEQVEKERENKGGDFRSE